MAIYRGWMMQTERYEDFHHQLLQNNIELITHPKSYSLLHYFPNIYPQIQNNTAKILLFPLHENIKVSFIRQTFKRFIVKDYVKSVKGSVFPSVFDSSISQEDFDQWMKLFYQYRGDLLSGGICIKEYLALKQYADTTNEYRVFYANQEVISVCKNSNQVLSCPAPPDAFISTYKNFDNPFYTIDYAELDDGAWIILETGDGSVSGLPNEQNPDDFFRALHIAFCDKNIS